MRTIAAAVTLLLCTKTWAFLTASQNNRSLTIANDRLVASVSKTKGYINVLTLDGQNLLGTESDNTGVGPYLDCYWLVKAVLERHKGSWLTYLSAHIVLRVASGHLVVAKMFNTNYSTALTRQVLRMAVSAWERHMRLRANGLNSTGS
jgi:hypothetical protein